MKVLDDPDEDCWPRITDLSALSPEDIKYRNTQFLKNDDHPYEMGFQETEQELRGRIWSRSNGRLRDVMREFPLDTTLDKQCAHWMHAWVGKHFFPDANHRTAFATLRTLFRENGIITDASTWGVERLRETRKKSRRVRREIANRGGYKDVRMDTLYRKDELYEVWLNYFQANLRIVVADEEESL